MNFLCKKTLIFDRDSKSTFVEGKYYKSHICENLPNFIPMETEGTSLCYFRRKNGGLNNMGDIFKFEDYFYTKIEERKLKLQKLISSELTASPPYNHDQDTSSQIASDLPSA